MEYPICVMMWPMSHTPVTQYFDWLSIESAFYFNNNKTLSRDNKVRAMMATSLSFSSLSRCVAANTAMLPATLITLICLALAGCGGFSKDPYWPDGKPERGAETANAKGDDASTPDSATQQTPSSPAAPSSGVKPVASTSPAPAADFTPPVVGCVVGGDARASQILDPDFQLQGPNPVGTAGDFLLSNEKAAFVITGLGPQKTYYHYSGILVDAVALDNCEQKEEENFFEMPLMVSRLHFTRQPLSTFRAFNAERLEIINDGSNGEAAIVRAYGSDDIYWLLEVELIARAALQNTPKSRSQPFNLDIEVDYILEPNSPTLKVEYRLRNRTSEFNSLSMAFVLLSAGGGPLLNTFSTFDLSAEGLNLQYGLPWVSASDGRSTYVYGADSDVLTTTHISGVDALFDARQFGNTWLGQLLAPHGQPRDTLQRDFYVTVTAGDELASIRDYLASTPRSLNIITTPVSGQVVDDATGAPLAGVKIEFQTLKQNFLRDWPFETFLTTYTDAQGQFGGDVPLLSYLPSNQPYRIIATQDGRDPVGPVALQPNQLNAIDLRMGGSGEVSYRIVDQNGQPSPARISVYRDDRFVKRLYTATGNGDFKLPPGNYQIGISRGFEYSIAEMSLAVTAGITTPLNASLEHMIDTQGFMSFDAHVHADPSPDSYVKEADRIRTAAATGLEVVVATDHEIITDLAPAVREAGAEAFVATVMGQEVTAGIPNHTIAYPLQHDPNSLMPNGKPRRQFVAWHGLDIAQIFAEEARRGAQVRTLAHPRSDYLNLIQWDRIAGAPGMTDPTRLGFDADAQLWSWDFEAMEYMNGPSAVFSSGLFEDWMSFLNHGHRITATGASDVHGFELPGMPRNYFPASSDRPGAFRENELVSAVQNGRLLVSTGAFARIAVNDTSTMGDTLTDTDGRVDLSLQVQALPQIDVEHVRVYVNCDEVARYEATQAVGSVVKLDGHWELPLPANEDAHIVVQGFGRLPFPRELPQFDATEVPRFVTNPVYVDGDGDGVFTAPGGKQCRF